MSTRYKADFYINTDFCFFFALPPLVENCDKSLMTESDVAGIVILGVKI